MQHKFLIFASFWPIFSALTCQSGQEKFILRQTIDQINWDGEISTFDETSFAYLLRSAIAYSLSDFDANDASSIIPASNVILSDPTVRVSGCIQVFKNTVPQESFSEDELIKALSFNQDIIYQITNTTAKELTFDGVYEVFEYVEPASFEPWLIPYIVFWCIIILTGFIMFKDAIYECFGCSTTEKESETEKVSVGEVNPAVEESDEKVQTGESRV